MSKPKFRLTSFSMIEQGTRFWFAAGGWKHYPATLITKSKYGKVRYHMGHDFNMKAKVFETFLNRKVWVQVK